MKTIFCLIPLLTLMTCVNQKKNIHKELSEDKLIVEFFNDKEVAELGKIIIFFENQVIEGNKYTIQKSYKNFLKQDSIRLIDEHLLFNFDYKKQKKLYLNLDTIFFKNFWDIGYGYGADSNDIEYEFFNIKSYDKYGQFLEKLSKQNHFFKDYYISTVISNDFLSPNASNNLIINYKSYNFKDIKVRLLYSLHYINQNEFLNKKIKHNL